MPRPTFTERQACFTWSTFLLNAPYNDDQLQATTTARQAAEALFTPKQAPRLPSQQTEDAVTRKPRVLAAAVPLARSQTVIAVETTQPKMRHPSPAEAPKPKGYHPIPKSQIDRVRTWMKYGMTARQAADACGVSVPELKDALRPS